MSHRGQRDAGKGRSAVSEDVRVEGVENEPAQTPHAGRTSQLLDVHSLCGSGDHGLGL
jgi:hypothetical protein